MRVRKAKCRPRDVLFARARVVYKVYVRQDNYDRAALPCSSPEGEGNCTLFNIATKLSQVDKPKDDLFACESLVQHPNLCHLAQNGQWVCGCLCCVFSCSTSNRRLACR